MSEIYFEVPISTHETRVNVPRGEEELFIFDIEFFESEITDLRTVTIIGDYREDGTKDVQSYSAPMKDYDRNEFEFEFEINEEYQVTILISEDNSIRSICVTY